MLQAALADFVASGGYDRHLDAAAASAAAAPRRAARGARARDAGRACVGPTPEGGYQVWVELPERLDTRELLADAVRAGVLFAPGYQFHHDGRPSRGLRLSLALADEDAIRRGVAALAAVVRERLRAAPLRAVDERVSV